MEQKKTIILHLLNIDIELITDIIIIGDCNE
mgnify:CR=1 FL=1